MYAVDYEVPGDADMYRKVKAQIGEELPSGLVVHFVVRTQGGLRHFEVWDSREAWERFRNDRVRPAVAKVLADVGITGTMPPPHENELDVIDVWQGAS
ncbi:MAG: hypothetical protein ACRDKJ_01980 [Actinomycetota bacterium]